MGVEPTSDLFTEQVHSHDCYASAHDFFHLHPAGHVPTGSDSYLTP